MKVFIFSVVVVFAMLLGLVSSASVASLPQSYELAESPSLDPAEVEDGEDDRYLELSPAASYCKEDKKAKMYIAGIYVVKENKFRYSKKEIISCSDGWESAKKKIKETGYVRIKDENEKALRNLIGYICQEHGKRFKVVGLAESSCEEE